MTSDWRLRATSVGAQGQTTPVNIAGEDFAIPVISEQQLFQQGVSSQPSPSVPFTPQQNLQAVGLNVTTPTPQATPSWRERAKPVSEQGSYAYSPQKELTPAQEFQNESPYLRTAGRGVRNVAAGAASLVDTALLLPKTAALGGALLTGNETLEKIGMTPTVRDMTLSGIDKLTGDKLKPTGAIDTVGDFLSEMTVPTSIAGKVSQGGKAPGVMDATRLLLNPTGAVEAKVKQALPAPEVLSKAPKVGFKEVRKEASRAYKEASTTGGVVKAEGADDFIQRMFKAAKPENERVERAFKDGPVSDLLESLQKEYTGKSMTLDDIEALDQKLGKEASRYFSKIDGAKPEYGQIKAVQGALRDAVEASIENPNLIDGSTEGFDAYKRGVMLYAKSKRLEEVDDVVKKALGQQQPARALRRGFNRIRNSKGYSRYSQEEQNIIDTIANEDLSDDAIKVLTSRFGALIGFGTGHPVLGSALAAGGAGARKLEKTGQLSKVNKLENKILEGTGLAQKLGPKDLSIFQKRGLNAIINSTARGTQGYDASNLRVEQ